MLNEELLKLTLLRDTDEDEGEEDEFDDSKLEGDFGDEFDDGLGEEEDMGVDIPEEDEEAA